MPLDGDAVGRREGQLAGEHLVQDAAKGIQVSGWPDGAGESLLGSHVRRGAHCLPDHGELGELPGAEQRGDPEVEYLDDAARGEEQVARLDVAVHHGQPVHFAEHGGDLRADGGCPGEWRGRGVVVVLGDQVGQLRAGEQLHDQVQVAGGLVGACVVDGRDARVRQGGGGLHLAQEPQPGVLRRLGLLGAQRLGRTAGCSSAGRVPGEASSASPRYAGRAGCRSRPTPRPCRPARSGGRGGTCPAITRACSVHGMSVITRKLPRSNQAATRGQSQA